MSERLSLDRASIGTLIRSVEERKSGFYLGVFFRRCNADLAYNWEEGNDDNFNYELPKLYYDRIE
jgi:hypothetical protein